MNSKRFDDDIWLLERITQGSEYDLHLAFWPQENQRILIKSLRPMADDLKRKKVESRLLKEASTLEEFWSPYFPKVYDIRRNKEGTLYLILQYFEGVSLRQFLDLNLENGIKFKVVEKINREITHALSYLHLKKNIIHFDLSPENIIISQENAIHLIDFEDAKIIGKTIAQKSIRGKSKYMAPELKFSAEQTFASAYFDEYAREVIFREMLSLCSSWERLRNSILTVSSSRSVKLAPKHQSIFGKTAIGLTLTLVILLGFTFGPFYKDKKTPIKPAIKASEVLFKKKNKPKRKKISRSPAIPKIQLVRRKSSALAKKKIIKPTFRQKFQKVLTPHDTKLKECLSGFTKKEILLSFVLERGTGKLIKLKAQGDLLKNKNVSACVSNIYRDLEYPLHPSGNEVEITQSIVLFTKK